jgi:Domain of unknown function DUF29
VVETLNNNNEGDSSMTHTSAPLTPNLYDTDWYLWGQTNAQLLREGRFTDLDTPHLIEEIEDMGRSQRQAIYSHLRNLLMHLLKWEFQTHMQSKSWYYSISNARISIARLIKESPSLKQLPSKEMADAYSDAVKLASVETGLDEARFPQTCPYQLEDVLKDGWLPSKLN